MTDRTISSAVPAHLAERQRDDTHCPAARPSRSSLQASVYRLRAEIDEQNRIIAEQRREIRELLDKLRVEIAP